MESLYLLSQKIPWQPRFPGMSQDPMQQIFPSYQYPVQNSWNALIPWKNWIPQQNQNQPSQGWRGHAYGNQIYQHPYQ